jgi:hypothetical protein
VVAGVQVDQCGPRRPVPHAVHQFAERRAGFGGQGVGRCAAGRAGGDPERRPSSVPCSRCGGSWRVSGGPPSGRGRRRRSGSARRRSEVVLRVRPEVGSVTGLDPVAGYRRPFSPARCRRDRRSGRLLRRFSPERRSA